MNNLPNNWEQAESQYNKHYDPLADVCPHCNAEDTLEEDEDEIERFWFCQSCGQRVEMQ